ncbi:hypothetical protein [Nostoc sp.]|uniref:hypothetical protein n=1 Tax=Nostoc sp. TaxID=1180 RepID=UPI002FF559AC
MRNDSQTFGIPEQLWRDGHSHQGVPAKVRWPDAFAMRQALEARLLVDETSRRTFGADVHRRLD